MTDLSKKVLPLLFLALFIFSCTSDPTSDSGSYTTVSPPEVKEKPEAIAAVEKSVEENTKKEEQEKKPVAEAKEKKEEAKKQEKKEEAKPKPKPKPRKRSKISFENTTHDYGVIMQGDKIEHNFKFTNKGTADLLITGVSASCGCTQPSYPFIPIKPGEEGKIGVVYDSKGKLGRQNPTITVVTNSRPSTYKLKLQGFVDAERAKEQPQTPKVEEKPVAPEAGEIPEAPENPVEGGGLF